MYQMEPVIRVTLNYPTSGHPIHLNFEMGLAFIMWNVCGTSLENLLARSHVKVNRLSLMNQMEPIIRVTLNYSTSGHPIHLNFEMGLAFIMWNVCGTSLENLLARSQVNVNRLSLLYQMEPIIRVTLNYSTSGHPIHLNFEMGLAFIMWNVWGNISWKSTRQKSCQRTLAPIW